METDSVLEALHGELKAMITQTITPAWKARVQELAKAEPREYVIISAFKAELEKAFEPIAAFPQRYPALRNRPAALAPNVRRYQEETAPQRVMTEQEHDEIIARKKAESPAFARMLSERRQPVEAQA